MTDALIEILPPGPPDLPVEEWSPDDLLFDGMRHGLIRLREIVMEPPPPLGDPDRKQELRAVMDAASILLRTTTRVSEGELRRKQGDKWQEFLAKISEHKKVHKTVDG